jgi:hypothetical protein
MWQTWVLVAYTRHLQVAAALLPSLLQLQLQLAPNLGLDMSAAGHLDYGVCDGRTPGAWALFMWGMVVGGACDTAHLEVTLALLAKHVDARCTAGAGATAFLVGASQGALNDSLAEQSPMSAAACSRAVAAQGANSSVSRKASFAANLLRAVQRWKSAEGSAAELPDTQSELPVVGIPNRQLAGGQPVHGVQVVRHC